MDISSIIDIFLHLDVYLKIIIENYGVLTYFLLFSVIFLETGLVITPFLPGDSLLFAAGAFAALGALKVWVVYITLCLAAIIGDSVNYWVGHKIGNKAFRKDGKSMINQEYLNRTIRFYEEHGGKTIILARFIPIIRTFAPFVAGITKMNYMRFLRYNIFGGIAWVSLFVWGGYWLGNVPIIRDNFSIVILIIIFISIIPFIVELIRRKLKK